jgi:hypothetical protein
MDEPKVKKVRAGAAHIRLQDTIRLRSISAATASLLIPPADNTPSETQ